MSSKHRAVATTALPLPSSPPSIITAWRKEGAWKNWTILLLIGVIVLLILTCTHLASRPPDVVLVSPDGKSTYVERSMVGDTVLKAIEETQGQPSDVTVVHFVQTFLKLALGIHSATVQATWEEALAYMTPVLAEKLRREYAEQRVVETWQLAQVQTSLHFKKVDLVERTDKLLHVRALVRRARSSLASRELAREDWVQVDLVLSVLRRSHQRPDGLEVRDFRVQPLNDGDSDAGVAPAVAQ